MTPPLGSLPPIITIDPNPATAGKKITITYTGDPGTVLVLEWDPEAEPTSVTIGEEGTACVTAPENATSLLVSDPNTTNGAADAAAAVDP